MKSSSTQQALEKFYVDELTRFYKSQERHGKSYLEATLRIWELNSKSGPYQNAYKIAVRQIKGEINDSERMSVKAS